jgi:hypothetical protein
VTFRPYQASDLDTIRAAVRAEIEREQSLSILSAFIVIAAAIIFL